MSSISSLGSDKSFTLPYYPTRKVEFVDNPVYSRLPRDDELYVMKAFARHAGHCSACAHPYDVHKRGGTLCSKGHQRALDVAQYLYNKRGETHSVVDHEGNRVVQVEIPANCDVVRSLLKAIERGLRLRRKTPTVSYDKTYPIPARIPSHKVQPDRTSDYRREPRYIRKPKLETAEPPPGYHGRHQQHRREKPYYAGRESVFERDLRERERRYRHRRPVYEDVPSPRYQPPVPPKDSYWI